MSVPLLRYWALRVPGALEPARKRKRSRDPLLTKATAKAETALRCVELNAPVPWSRPHLELLLVVFTRLMGGCVSAESFRKWMPEAFILIPDGLLAT